MNIQLLSDQYAVKKITNEDIPDVLSLCKGNPVYYKYCPPAVSVESIKSDLKALPRNKTYKDKYYIGFYTSNKLIAVMDLICKYPDDEAAFVGFFMLINELQGRGVGTEIITKSKQYLKSVGFKRIMLGYVKDNPQSKAFWEKNQFKATGDESKQEHYTIVWMKNEL